MQQHLEPTHIADIQIPLPDDTKKLNVLMQTVTEALEAHERSIEMADMADAQIIELFQMNEDEFDPKLSHSSSG